MSSWRDELEPDVPLTFDERLAVLSHLWRRPSYPPRPECIGDVWREIGDGRIRLTIYYAPVARVYSAFLRSEYLMSAWCYHTLCLRLRGEFRIMFGGVL